MKATDWLQAVGQVAQAVVAAIALYWTARQFLQSRRQSWEPALRDRLLTLLSEARLVRNEYHAFFREFASVEEKRTAREAFVSRREQLAEFLDDLDLAYPAVRGPIAAVRDAWKNCIREEADCVGSDSLKAPTFTDCRRALGKYGEVEATFRQRVRDLLNGIG